jgi:hypothetical protein
MLNTVFARLSVLVIASLAVGCRSSPKPIAAADTAFIEERRYEERGVRMGNRGCRFRSSITLPAVPAADTVRRWTEHRSISVDPNTCVRVMAAGYRKVRPPMEPVDMTGMAETTATAVYDSSKPLPPLPP